MKCKWFLKAISYLLTFTLLLSVMQLDVLAMDYDPSQPSVTDPLDYPLPDPEKESEYQIIGEQEEKRDGTTKYFLTEHGNGIAAVYNEPVHYQTKDGSWEEIDNSLAEATDSQIGEVFENAANDVTVKFTKKRDHKRLVTLDDGDYQLSWGFENAQKSGGNKDILVTEPVTALSDKSEEIPVTQEEIHAYNQKKMGVSKNQSEALYEDVYPNIDVQYIVTGKTVKENIILNDKSAAGQAISFHIRHNRMHIRAEEDGSLSLVENAAPQDVIYTLAAPYMVDANGEISRDVRFEVEPGKNIHESVVRVIADQEWLNASERAYPVVIDPIAETSKDSRNIYESYIYLANPNDNSGYLSDNVFVGCDSAKGETQTYLKFADLPNLDQGALITKAELNIYQYNYDCPDGQPMNIMAHENMGDWGDGLTWNYCPDRSDWILDYETVSNSTNGYPLSFDITKAVRKWYNGQNYGIMLRREDELNGRLACVELIGSDFDLSGGISEMVLPSGIFWYKNTWGMEDYWNYHSQMANRSGSGHINIFNGNLVYTIGDTATSGSRLPVGVNHVYNANDRGTEDRKSVV